MHSYGRWLTGVTGVIGIPYLGEKWASQEPPKRWGEWGLVLAVVVVLPLVFSSFENRLKTWFFSHFSPSEASHTELKQIRHLIGVDHLRLDEIRKVKPSHSDDAIADDLFGSEDDERFFECLKTKHSEIRKQSSIAILGDEFSKRHFAAAYGTAGLVCQIVHEQTRKPFYFDSIHLIITEPLPEKIKSRYMEYVKKLLRAIGVLNESGNVFFNFHDVNFVDTKLEHLRSYYEVAARKALESGGWNGSPDKAATDFQIGVDLTGGTVLHSLAGAKIADEFEALLIYNVAQRQRSGAAVQDLLTVVRV